MQIEPPVQHQVEMEVLQNGNQPGEVDGIHESAENVPRRFRLLMDVVMDEESMMSTDLIRIKPGEAGRLIVQLVFF